MPQNAQSQWREMWMFPIYRDGEWNHMDGPRAFASIAVLCQRSADEVRRAVANLEAMDQEILQVHGLGADQYSLQIDGKPVLDLAKSH